MRGKKNSFLIMPCNKLRMIEIETIGRICNHFSGERFRLNNQWMPNAREWIIALDYLPTKY